MAKKSRAADHRTAGLEKASSDLLPACFATEKSGQDAQNYIRSQVKASPNDKEDVPEATVSLPHSISDDLSQVRAPNIGEFSPDLGIARLIPSKRDIGSANRAHDSVLKILEKEKIELDELDWLPERLITISQTYWAEYKRDHRVVISDMKEEVTKVQRDLAKLVEQLGTLPLATRQALNAKARLIMPKRNGPSPNYVSELHEQSKFMHDACREIASTKNPTRVRRSHRFERCGAALWAVREKITGKPMSKTFDLHEDAFISADAAFVCDVMKAIDDEATARQVQDGLRRAARAKKENSALKSAAINL